MQATPVASAFPWWQPWDATPVRVRPWQYGARVTEGPNCEHDVFEHENVVVSVLRKPDPETLAWWAKGCTIASHWDFPNGGYSPGRSALVTVWSGLGPLLGSQDFCFKIYDDNMTDIELVPGCEGTCDMEAWWGVWEQFIRMSIYLMLRYLDAPRQFHHPTLNWTEEMIVFEINHWWHDVIVSEVGTALLNETNLQECRKKLIARSRAYSKKWLFRLGRAGWAPVFQLYHELCVALVCSYRKVILM